MKLRSINIVARSEFQDRNFWDIFNYNTDFIGNWMSRKVRLLKLPTDGTFNQINVVLSPYDDRCYTDVFRILQVEYHFSQEDIQNYLSLKNEDDRLNFYIELLKKGLRRAAQYKDINLDVLIALVEEFQNNEYRNEWLFKSKTIRERNIRVVFMRCFTTYAFELKLYLYDKKNKLIAEKTVFKIYPDEIFVQGLFHSITKDSNHLYIDNTFDRHVLSFSLNDLERGIIKEVLLNEEKKKYIYDREDETYRRIEWRYKQD